MTTYVLDASVVLKYSLEKIPAIEKYLLALFNKAEAKKVSLISPPILYSEVANGLRFNLKDQPKAISILAEILQLPIKVVSIQRVHYPEILQLAYQNHTTVYDTSYHFLAISRNAIFLTCDQDYYKKSHHLGHIKLLK